MNKIGLHGSEMEFLKERHFTIPFRLKTSVNIRRTRGDTMTMICYGCKFNIFTEYIDYINFFPIGDEVT